MARCAILFFQYCPLRYGFSCNLDSQFCLFATGGIYVKQSFTNVGGEIQISGSLAEYEGGPVLTVLWGLWQDFEMAVGSETKLACQVVQVLMFSTSSFPLFE